MRDDDLEWKPYLRDRSIARHPSGFFVIVPTGAEPPVPLACEVCTRLLRSRDDEASHLEFGCCHLCALQWAHPRREAWKSGWRPTKIAIDEAVVLRPPLFVTFEVD